MQARARTLAKGIQTLDAGLTVQVYLDTTAHIVGSRSYRDIIGGDVDTDREALLVDVREVLACFFRVFMGHVETHVV